MHFAPQRCEVAKPLCWTALQRANQLSAGHTQRRAAEPRPRPRNNTNANILFPVMITFSFISLPLTVSIMFDQSKINSHWIARDLCRRNAPQGCSRSVKNTEPLSARCPTGACAPPRRETTWQFNEDDPARVCRVVAVVRQPNSRCMATVLRKHPPNHLLLEAPQLEAVAGEPSAKRSTSPRCNCGAR